MFVFCSEVELKILRNYYIIDRNGDGDSDSDSDDDSDGDSDGGGDGFL